MAAAIKEDRSMAALENWLARRPGGLSSFETPTYIMAELELISDNSWVCPDWRIVLTVYKTATRGIADYTVLPRNECLWFL